MGDRDMFLDKFNQFEEIVIQCHDNPDADTIGSGFALYYYFRKMDKKVRLIYTGANQITKPSLLLMIDKLGIPIEYVEEDFKCSVLITVDCQYGGGNITCLEAEQVAMIDHHPSCVPVDEWCMIQKTYGSCCTVIWELLMDKGINVNDDVNVATALYYGLYSDTGQLSEIYQPQDRRLRDYLQIDRAVMDRIVNSNLLREELRIAGEALSNYYYDEKWAFAIIPTKPCDPNLLGVINDLAIQTDTITLSVAFCETIIGYKFSVRSNLNEARASHLAQYISEGLGSGGGHVNKAGGYILKSLFGKKYPADSFGDFLRKKICEFEEKDHHEGGGIG